MGGKRGPHTDSRPEWMFVLLLLDTIFWHVGPLKETQAIGHISSQFAPPPILLVKYPMSKREVTQNEIKKDSCASQKCDDAYAHDGERCGRQRHVQVRGHDDAEYFQGEACQLVFFHSVDEQRELPSTGKRSHR